MKVDIYLDRDLTKRRAVVMSWNGLRNCKITVFYNTGLGNFVVSVTDDLWLLPISCQDYIDALKIAQYLQGAFMTGHRYTIEGVLYAQLIALISEIPSWMEQEEMYTYNETVDMEVTIAS